MESFVTGFRGTWFGVRGTKVCGALCVSALMATGCSSAELVESEPTDGIEQSMINGAQPSSNSVNAVAIYHRVRDFEGGPFYWSARPCSGRILTPRAPYRAVLTARHCVTELGKVSGVTIGPDKVRITAALSPGPAWPNPPPDAVMPYEVQPYDNADIDLAILWVFGPIPGMTLSPTTIGLYLGSTTSLNDVSTPASVWGYGWTIYNLDLSAGYLRRANDFSLLPGYWGNPTATGVDYPEVSVANPSPSGAEVARGDSGGPWLRSVHQVGVSATEGSITPVARRTAAWIVSKLARLYLRPYGAFSRGMKWSGWGVNVTAEMAAADLSQWWEYNWQTREIRSAAAASQNLCLDIPGNNPVDNTPIQMWGCNSGDAQKWIITPQYQIKSEVHGKCIELVNLGMVLKPCSSSNQQKWVWDTDSRVPDGY